MGRIVTREEEQSRIRLLLVVFLTINSGATDAIGYIALGGAFTSVMTGNIILLGIAGARSDGKLAGHVAVAIACYVAGCVIGARLVGTPQEGDPVWPLAVTRALIVELAVFLVYAIGWWANGSRPSSTAELVLLAVNAVALGIQSSTVQRFGVPGLSTTYMTGTLTMLAIRLASGHGVRAVSDSALLLLGLGGGAVVAALMVAHARALVPCLQLACLVVALIGSTFAMRAGRRPGTDTGSRIESAPGLVG